MAGTILASALVDQAEEILQDSANDRYSAAELLAWLNLGTKAIVREKPDANPVRESMLLVAGIWQTLPDTAIMLLDVTMNMGLTPVISDWMLKVPYAYLDSEVVTNGTMEADSNWTAVGTTTSTRSSTYAKTGTYSRKAINTAASSGIKSDAFTSIISRLYRYQVWVYPTLTTVVVTIRNGADSGNTVAASHTVVANQWNLLTGYYVEAAGGAASYIQVTMGVGTMYVDLVSVVPIVAYNEVRYPVDYSTESSPITIVARKWMDTAIPDWTTATASVTTIHVVYDPKTNPKKFMVYPAATGTGYIEIVTAKLPADVTIGAAIPIGDEYAEMLIDYMVFRALSRDSDYAANSQRALAHYSNFLMLVGKLDANELNANPKKGQGDN